MKNKNNSQESAFGFAAQLSRDEDVYSHGLTKRELFAAMAMQGLLCNPDAHWEEYNAIGEIAVHHADALLIELNKGKESEE